MIMATLLQNLKKTAALAVALLAISLNINAQTWYIHVDRVWSAPHPITPFEETYNQGEAVEIAGMEYLTIYVYNHETGTTSLAGAYRNEDNLVFYCKWNGSAYETEELLYDYDLEEGDFFHEDDPHWMQVTEVSTITDLNGVSRKKLSFSFNGLPDETEFWIEGVGSSRGFIHVGMYEPEHDSDGELYHLLCYHEGDDVIFVNPEYNDCDLPYSTDENLAENGIEVYPNPAKDIVNILNNNDLNITSIEIIDLTGRTVLSTEKSENIDITELSEGQYFAKIIGETTTVKKLFIAK